jgi:hypothetical protein
VCQSYLSFDKWVTAVAFVVALQTFIDELNIKFQRNINYCVILFLMWILWSEADSGAQTYQGTNSLRYFFVYNIIVECLTSTVDWQTLKSNFVVIMSQHQNEFSSNFGDLPRRTDEIQIL